MSQQAVDTRPHGFISTVLAGDLEGHMAMISPDVMVLPAAGLDTLVYSDRYRHEFPLCPIRARDSSHGH